MDKDYLKWMAILMCLCESFICFRLVNAQPRVHFSIRNSAKKNFHLVSGIRVEELLDSENYHKYIRPGENSDQPLKVNVSIAVSSIEKVSDMKMEYTITFTLYQTWRDERLDKLRIGVLKPLTMDTSVSRRMWLPDTYIVNSHTAFVHDVTQRHGLVILYPNGTVIYVLQITSQVECGMHFFKYPMDEQVCELKLASWSFTNQNLLYNWKGNESCDSSQGSITGVEDVMMSQFDLTECSISSSTYTRSLGNFSQLLIKFRLKRNIGFFILQTYVPSVLLVMISWVSFWIDPISVPARVSLGITTVLSMTTLMMGVYSSGPKSTSYIKALDSYVLVCYGFIFVAMIEYACVHFYLKFQTSRKFDSIINSEEMQFNLYTYAYDSHQFLNQKSSSKANAAVMEENVGTAHLIVSNAASQCCKDQIDYLEKREAVVAAESYRNVKYTVDYVDQIFRVLAPSLFLVFNVLYWIIYLNMQN